MASDFKVLSSGDESGSPLGKKDDGQYSRALIEQMWRYRQERFAGQEELFDRPRPSKLRPPVFRKDHADRNVITESGGPADLDAAVLGAIPPGSRHRWFASMKSSQVLVQSVFANLAVRGQLDLLAGLESDDGETAFYEHAPSAGSLRLEETIRYLGEPTGTSVDLMIDGQTRVAIECKFSEWEVGSCSRPMTEDDDPRYCDGSYHSQGSRVARCQLTEIGVRYWDYVPRLFEWSAEEDHRPCPMRFTFQLVRNVLSACVTPDGKVDDSGHCLLVYDARNPAFQKSGAGLRAFEDARAGLNKPSNLRRIPWQRILTALDASPNMNWLSTELRSKYGF